METSRENKELLLSQLFLSACLLGAKCWGKGNQENLAEGYPAPVVTHR